MAHPTDASGRRASLARALVMLHRYSVDITGIAVQSLGHNDIENRDIQAILALHDGGQLNPTHLAELTGAPRSTVSRSMNRLEGAGLARRRPDVRDGRSVLMSLTPKGRRRVASFASRLADYFASGEPMLKEAFHLLDAEVPAQDPSRPADPMLAAAAMSRAGAEYVAEVVEVLQPFGIRDFTDRFTLALLHLRGVQRPTQLADELNLTASGTSGVLTRLERAGLISRRHDLILGDRRAVIVELTSRGEEAMQLELDVFERHAAALARPLSLTWRSAPEHRRVGVQKV